eukprot:CAMPEP_0179914416 /NCGR_PEP_ID=MMETSP0983-20121128/1067_1 /TAXON_ID=483367 /ORGANISM="non described non described, Strain CCMP 2436" /LENGTH=66 /DNA_ID=CAMNT_0021816641 /DNA_START=359 /DNA_END=559 /DNA_ORIENTATION=-
MLKRCRDALERRKRRQSHIARLAEEAGHQREVGDRVDEDGHERHSLRRAPPRQQREQDPCGEREVV